MKNALLLVALFLGGMTTQTIAQNHGNGKVGKTQRYHNTESIQFVENDVLFTIFTDGTFSFTDQFNGSPYRYDKKNYNKNHKKNYYGKKGRRGHGRKIGHRAIRVNTDYYGNIVGINDICISYKRNGKVKQIGSVPLYYERGSLTQIGGMTLQYNRFGEIRNTFGSINRYNRGVWHDDWYAYSDDRNDRYDRNDRDDGQYYGRRIRTK